MKRREFITLPAAWPLASRAQTPDVTKRSEPY